MKLLTFTLLLFCAFNGFSQSSASSEPNPIDTADIETKCECLQRKYDLKREILDNTKFDENGRLSIDPALVEKRQYTFLSLKALSEKCDQPTPAPDTETCPEEAQLTEIDADFELILRVIEMNALPHSDY